MAVGRTGHEVGDESPLPSDAPTKPEYGPRPTMKDVARRANVSASTVSYVLNDSGPVSPERRQRVLEAVRVLNYTPNAAARNLKRGGASTIGLVVPDLANQFFALLAQGVERAASAHDMLVVLCAPETSDQAESYNARLLQSRRVDGVIYLSGFGTSPRSLLELTNLGPVVLVDERIPGFDLPAIASDARPGARQAAQHVLEQGHERIAVIGGPPELWTAQQRLAGYREAYAAAGLNPDNLLVFDGDYRQPAGMRLAEQALALPAGRRPTALLCANDMMAIGAIEYCRSSGLRIPEDVSIVGFDDLPFVSLLAPRLTTVRQYADEMGYRAATVLFDLLDGVALENPDELFPVELQVRDSVAPPHR